MPDQTLWESVSIEVCKSWRCQTCDVWGDDIDGCWCCGSTSALEFRSQPTPGSGHRFGPEGSRLSDLSWQQLLSGDDLT